MTTTWNSSLWNSQMVLSNGNLTATANAGNSVCGIAVDAITGKKYVELVLDVTDGSGQVGFGIANASVNRSNYLGADTNGVGYWPGPGQVYTNGGVTNTIATGTTNGTVVCMAIDATAKLLWFRINNGNWNNSGTANPATGTGGISYSLSGSVYPALALTRNTEQATARFASGSWGYSAPSGFTEVSPAAGTVRIFLTTTGAGSWVAPNDFNPYNNTIETLGAGGAAARAVNSYGGGGGGGAYSAITNANIFPGDSVAYSVGAGGLGTSSQNVAGSGGDTWLGNAVYASALVGAKGGVGGGSSGASATAGTGGLASAGIGTVKYNGGNGSAGANPYAGAGGGAGGPNGAGNNGASGVGGSGDAGFGGAGGPTGSSPGASGGAAGTEWDATHGSGGGAGGYNAPINAAGSNGGAYGAGGGGARSGGTYAGGNGYQGLIVITYVPWIRASFDVWIVA